MLTTPHALAGAAIGSLFPTSVLGCIGAFALAFGSHFVLDSVPHWERLFATKNHTELAKKGYNVRDAGVYLQVVLDGLVGLGAIYLASRHLGTISWTNPVIWGGIGGILPDALDNVHPISRRLHHVGLFSNIEKLHKKFHINYEAQRRLPKYTGLMTQALVIVLSLAALR